MSKVNAGPVLAERAVEAHTPDLYRSDTQAQLINDLTELSDKDLCFFREQGYLAVKQVFTAEQIGTPNSLYSMATGKRAKGEWEHHGLATLYVSIVRPSLDVRWTPELSSEALDPLADLRTKIKYFLQTMRKICVCF
jgi:hypothetical protein